MTHWQMHTTRFSAGARAELFDLCRECVESQTPEVEVELPKGHKFWVPRRTDSLVV